MFCVLLFTMLPASHVALKRRHVDLSRVCCGPFKGILMLFLIHCHECAAEDVSDLADHFCLQLKGELSITHIHLQFIEFFRIIYNF